jgi:NTE family protein
MVKERIGLALSGGGYRASAFHLGTLKKLNELGILNKIDVISTISGGSITGAAWCLHDGDYDSFYEKMAQSLRTKDVILYVLRSWIFIRLCIFVLVIVGSAIFCSFTSWSYLTFPLLLLFLILLFKYQFKIFLVSKVIEKAYNKYFYQGKKLKDLKDKPLIAIGSSNLHSGRPFTFSKAKMSDSSYV